MLTNNTTNGDNQAENLAIIYVGNALTQKQNQCHEMFMAGDNNINNVDHSTRLAVLCVSKT